MATEAISKPATKEEKLAEIIRRLPPGRVAEVVDFAQFLELRTAQEEVREESARAEASATDEARWDMLLATNESQRCLEKMADEALAEIQAGRARPIVFTQDGEIAPG
jgi:hypothetical protein